MQLQKENLNIFGGNVKILLLFLLLFTFIPFVHAGAPNTSIDEVGGLKFGQKIPANFTLIEESPFGQREKYNDIYYSNPSMTLIKFLGFEATNVRYVGEGGIFTKADIELNVKDLESTKNQLIKTTGITPRHFKSTDGETYIFLGKTAGFHLRKQAINPNLNIFLFSLKYGD